VATYGQPRTRRVHAIQLEIAWGEPWVQLMGDSPEDWGRLEALAAAGIRTCPATALIELRRRAILREWSAPPVPS
jgi:hypothetical protein